MGMLDEVKSKKKEKAAENWFKMAEGAKTPEKQIEYYTRSLDSNPYNAEAWFRKGRILEKMGNFEEAKRSFDLAIEIDPDYQGIIGRKQPAMEEVEPTFEDMAPEAVPDVAPDTGENTFSDISAVDSGEEQAFETVDEDTKDGGWVTETPQPERGSFTPPVGEESIFSNLDSEGPADEDESDDSTFESSLSDVGDESVSSLESIESEEPIPEETPVERATFTDVFSDDVKKEDNTFTDAPDVEKLSFSDADKNVNVIEPAPSVSTPAPAPTIKESSRSAFEAPQTETVAGTLSKPVSAAPLSSVSSAPSIAKPVASASPIALNANQCVDVKIPLNEALRFWAIGIVAMVIAFVITNLIIS
ncbi:tetratricopeptide repeat protein [Methanolobus sp. ZRKC3]|uniref:tetratricopeptide repeat protein n=1 Tax=Methanolobus sp. ZRKC3 TaxID=3125786 RepID=UPI00324BBAFE